MANLLSDNTVIPSYLGTSDRGDVSVDPGNQSNIALRYGEVRKVIYPDDAKSVSKRFIEYNVEIQHKDQGGHGTGVTYANCVQMSLFGTTADLFRYTLREDREQQGQSGLGVGSKVVVMCLNGNVSKALIVGALRDTGTDKDGTLQEGRDKKEDGHNLFFEFNGAQVGVNKDGELQVRYRGATKVDGTLQDDADPEAEGSTIVFTKEGGIKAYTRGEKQFIHLDHKNKKLDILADEEWHVKVNKKLFFEAGDTVNIKGDSTCTVEMTDRVYIKSAGVHVGAAGEDWMMGTTYRRAEQTMHQTMTGLLNTLSGLITTAATNLNVAAGLHKIPIAGPIVGSAPLQAAAVALTSAGPIFTSLASAITGFESGAAGYLSLKNKND